MNYEQKNENEYSANTYYEEKSLSYHIKRFLIGLLLAVVIIFLLVWIFPTKAGLKNTIDDSISDAFDKTFAEKLNPLYDRIFSDNIETMKKIAISYFTTERLPKAEGQTKKLTLQQMMDMKLILALKDKNGKMCNTKESYVEITKMSNEYKLKVNLSCGDEEDYVITYLGCYNYCLNDVCEKKTVTQAKKTVAKTKKIITKKTTPKKHYCEVYNKKYYGKNGTVVSKSTYQKQCVKQDVYKYLYEKKVSINHEKEYSNWSDWSLNYEYDPENNNINWGQHELEWNEKTGYKQTKYYEYTEDRNQPIYNTTYDRIIGYKNQYACDGYTYYIDNTTSITYISSNTPASGWTKIDRVTLQSMPTNTSTKKYVYIGMNYDHCASTCTLKPYYIFDVYTRNPGTAVTSQVSSDKATVKAVCSNVIETQIPIYGKRTTFAGYVTNRELKEKRTYYYHKKTRTITKEASTETKKYEVWSLSKNDKTLIAQGYKYTGKYKKIAG